MERVILRSIRLWPNWHCFGKSATAASISARWNAFHLQTDTVIRSSSSHKWQTSLVITSHASISTNNMHRLRGDFVSSTRYPLEQKTLNINKLLLLRWPFTHLVASQWKTNPLRWMYTSIAKVEEQQQNVTAKEDTKETRTQTFVIQFVIGTSLPPRVRSITSII